MNTQTLIEKELRAICGFTLSSAQFADRQVYLTALLNRVADEKVVPDEVYETVSDAATDWVSAATEAHKKGQQLADFPPDDDDGDDDEEDDPGDDEPPKEPTREVYFGRPVHPVAALFPLMQGDEFNELVADIKANGLREAIVLSDGGEMVDGRNRARACKVAEVEPRFDNLDVGVSIIDYIVSKNLRRRHLNESQRGMVAANLKPLLAKEAAKRKEATQFGQKEQKTQQNTVSANLHSPLKSTDRAAQTANAQAGRMLNVSARQVAKATTVKGANPELAEEVAAGKKSLHRAYKETTGTAAKAPPDALEPKSNGRVNGHVKSSEVVRDDDNALACLEFLADHLDDDLIDILPPDFYALMFDNKHRKDVQRWRDEDARIEAALADAGKVAHH
jgi:hypothetical protein